MDTCRALALACAIASSTAYACLPARAVAQERAFRFEITPFGAHRFGGEFEEAGGDGELELDESHAEGILLNIAARAGGHWEILYARQDTTMHTRALLAGDPQFDVDVEYWHFGGNYSFEYDDERPFLAFTLGISRFDPYPPDLRAETYPSASIGGGWQLRSTKRLGVRIEGRVFTTFVDGDSDTFCGSIGGTGVCAFDIESETLTQWEARAGLVFRF